jgi:opacity protein-like surface antigen
MKKTIIGLAAGLILAAGAGASGLLDRWSLRLSPGGMLALGGWYNDSVKLNKVVNIGIGLGGGVRYKINDYAFLDADYAFTWMSVKKSYQPFDYKEEHPALNLQMITVNGTFFLSVGYVFKPYVTLGAGIYPWEFSQTPLWGDPWPAPGDPTLTFSKVSPGLNGGLGLEMHLFSTCSVFAEARYHYVFARDPYRLGTDDFTEHDFLGFQIGLVYSFSKK